jgi:hypothetical protein
VASERRRKPKQSALLLATGASLEGGGGGLYLVIDGEIVVDEGIVCVCVFEGGRERASERKSDGERRERESVSWNTVITSNRGVVGTARHSPGSQNILWNQVSDPRHILGTEETGSERTPILPGYKRTHACGYAGYKRTHACG